jgi:hypothetical protein
MTNPSELIYDYAIFKGEELTFSDGWLVEWTNSVEEAEQFLEEEEDAETYELFTVDKSHYFKCFFIYNDMNDYDDVENYMEMDFVSMEHAELYQDINNGDGHHQWIKSEEWKDGELVNTIIHSDKDGNYLV